MISAVVIPAKCQISKKSFGIRAQSEKGYWIYTWAFPILEEMAKKEGYDKTQITGSVSIHPNYPGCPYCEGKSFFQCGKCKKIACYAGKKEVITCPHCSSKSGFKIVDSFNNIEGGSF